MDLKKYKELISAYKELEKSIFSVSRRLKVSADASLYDSAFLLVQRLGIDTGILKQIRYIGVVMSLAKKKDYLHLAEHDLDDIISAAYGAAMSFRIAYDSYREEESIRKANKDLPPDNTAAKLFTKMHSLFVKKALSLGLPKAVISGPTDKLIHRVLCEICGNDHETLRKTYQKASTLTVHRSSVNLDKAKLDQLQLYWKEVKRVIKPGIIQVFRKPKSVETKWPQPQQETSA